MESEIQQWSDRAKQIRVLHNQILFAYRKSVEDAIRIGEILSIQKQDMDHGKYTAWIKAELPFSEDSAERYALLFEYQDKIRTMRNLQEAYAKVKHLQAEKRREDQERKNKLIAQYEVTGEKAEGWDRSVDYELKKREGVAPKEESAQEHETRIDEQYEKEKAHEKAKRELVTQIDRYLKAYPDDIDYLQAYLLDKKMTLPHPRSDADIDRVLANFQY